MLKNKRLVIPLIAAVAGLAASAATLEAIDVDHEGGVYRLHAETLLEARPESIAAVLLDYERFGRISSVYKEYGYLEPASDGTPIVFTTMEGCVMKLFCKSMTRVERLESAEPGHIRTVALPERSDFKRSVSDWVIEREDSATRMVYTLEMEPDFFVPWVIGPAMLKRTLKRGGGDVIERIERLALAIEADSGERAAFVRP